MSVLFQIRFFLKHVFNISPLLKKIPAGVLIFLAFGQVSAQTPLFTQVLVSDVGTGNSIGSANTSRNIAVDAQGNIGVVYLGSEGLRFAKSIDRGASFLPSVKISNATTGDCEVEVADNGNVYVIYSNGSQISLFTSLNGGVSFSGPNVLGPGAVPHIASYGSNVYVVPKLGTPVYRNTNNGVGSFLTTLATARVYADIRVDKANGDVYLIQDLPQLFLYRSTNAAASFTNITIPGSVNYSSYSITTGPLGKYIYVAGYNTQGYRIDFTTGASTVIPVGSNPSIGMTDENRLLSEGRTLASDEFGNFIDGYTVSATTMAFHVSNDLGNTFGSQILISNATSHNIARNPATQDIDVVYRGTDGKIYLNVYNDLLKGLTISQTGHTYCPGSTGNVNYSIRGATLNPANEFVVQLSDANRDFSNPKVIGSLASTETTGSIAISIPPDVAFGSNYRMRVVSTDAALNGSDNAFDISINPSPSSTISAGGPTTFCAGGSVVLSADLQSPDVTYLWNTGATTRSITASTSGDYKVTVTTACGSLTSAPVTVTARTGPAASIVADGSTSFCEDGLVTLNAVSDSPVNTYLWNTGATTASIIATTGGTYTVAITNNCGTTVSAPVLISRAPAAGISASGPTTFCTGGSVQLTAISDGRRDTYLWSNGATTKTITVAAAGNYTVKVTNICGLSTTSAPQTITLKPVPVVDFILPEACLTDGIGTFSNRSTIAAGGGTLTYLWDFGDRNASSQRPNTSTDKDPAHVYSAPGTYQVSLTVTASNGCSETLIKPFTISASIPKADFNVLNSNSLCSDAPVIFEDKANLAFGEVTRIEWYFDVDAHPTDPLFHFTDNTPNLRSGNAKQYSFLYPVLHAPLSKMINVKMKAFSGPVCVGEITKSLTLKAVPDLVFAPLPDICAEEAPLQLNQASEIAGVPGNGSYTGPGVSASGKFDPLAAGVGIHTITYTFIGTNGCTAQIARDIKVNSTPVVSAGKDGIILQGSKVQLSSAASGKNLTYKWVPSTGLDKDDIPNPVAAPLDDITYVLTVTSTEGCTAVDEVFIKVLKLPEVPNTFTPNGDGVNDTWFIKNLGDYPGASMDIFNRFGNKVHAATGFLQPWDGKMNGEYLPGGTYYYIINPRNGRNTITGQITIIK